MVEVKVTKRSGEEVVVKLTEPSGGDYKKALQSNGMKLDMNMNLKGDFDMLGFRETITALSVVSPDEFKNVENIKALPLSSYNELLGAADGVLSINPQSGGESS